MQARPCWSIKLYSYNWREKVRNLGKHPTLKAGTRLQVNHARFQCRSLRPDVRHNTCRAVASRTTARLTTPPETALLVRDFCLWNTPGRPHRANAARPVAITCNPFTAARRCLEIGATGTNYLPPDRKQRNTSPRSGLSIAFLQHRENCWIK